jgi:hypothetical protein
MNDFHSKYKELQEEFQATHQHVDELRKQAVNPKNLQKKITLLEQEKEQLINKINMFKTKNQGQVYIFSLRSRLKRLCSPTSSKRSSNAMTMKRNSVPSIHPTHLQPRQENHSEKLEPVEGNEEIRGQWLRKKREGEKRKRERSWEIREEAEEELV